MIGIGVFAERDEINTFHVQVPSGTNDIEVLDTILQKADQLDPSMMASFLIVDGDSCRNGDTVGWYVHRRIDEEEVCEEQTGS